MSKNNVKKIFTSSTTWTAPAGVTQVKVKAVADLTLLPQLAAGGAHSIAVAPNGDVWNWGSAANGQLGCNDITQRSSPVMVIGNRKIRQVRAGAGGNWSNMLDETGDAFSFGIGSQGQLGNNDGVNVSSPTMVLGGHKFRTIASGFTAAYGIDELGAAWAWGQGSDGRLGNNTVTAASTPVAVSGGLTFKKIVGGVDYAVGITEAGVPYAWGANVNGELGTNNITPRSTPTLVVGSKVFTDIATGSGSATYGLDAAGAMWAWGYDDASGRHGTGGTTPKSSPVAVVGSHVFRRIAAGAGCAFGIDTAGALWSWGNGSGGKLGNNTTTSVQTPIAVSGGHVWADIAADDHVIGLRTDGRILAWGTGTNGRLGDGTATSKSTPTLVLGPNSWQQVVYKTLNNLTITVVPNTVYAITLTGFTSFFGTTPIAGGTWPQFMTLEYFG